MEVVEPFFVLDDVDDFELLDVVLVFLVVEVESFELVVVLEDVLDFAEEVEVFELL